MKNWKPALPSRVSKDLCISIAAGVLALAVYALTLAPSVQPGDVAELQYIVSRLGIPHPNGYPFYLLIGKLWSLLPIGELAWRINLLSAVLAALCVGLSFLLLRSAGLCVLSALTGAFFLAFQRTFWTWAGLAHRYSLWMGLGIGLLLALMLWRNRGLDRWFLLAALLGGLGQASHIASLVFLLPGFVLILYPGRAGRLSLRLLGLALVIYLIPLLLYLYVPFRGLALWQASPVDSISGQPLAVLHGIIHPRFEPNSTAILQYLSAGLPTRVGSVVLGAFGNAWDLPRLVQSEFGPVWLLLATAGVILAFLRNRPWALALSVLFIADLLLSSYWRQGNVEAYFLPATFALAMFLAEVVEAVLRWAQRLPGRPMLQHTVSLVMLALPLMFVVHNIEASSHRGDLTLDHYWRTVLALPLEQGAGLIAHWSDLTPLWYFQQTEALRTDLLGLYLPEVEQMEAALQAGRALYVVGPLGDWYRRLPANADVVPWGPLVKLVPNHNRHYPLSVTDTLIEQSLGDQVVLRSLALPAVKVESGKMVPITLAWESRKPIVKCRTLVYHL